ncbi:SCO-spondin-like, partial [Haliotis rubra]|uniref:SCO-spondin-like n=1 Tax=Haliotis rubra TaxID=36100 RepID=UPI001EE5BF0A
FLLQLQNVAANPGTTTFFQTRVSGSVTANGTWAINGVPLTNQPGKYDILVNGAFRQLFITNLATSDAGTVTFTVNGEVTSAQLTVLTAILTGLTGQTVNTGSQVTLVATLSQSNIQTGQWYKNGAILALNSRIQASVNGQSQILSISNVQTSDGATYEYRLNGQSTSAVLTVNVPIGPIVNGGFSQWSNWTGLPCGVACETRTDVLRTRTRTCTNPPPSNGGLNCTGSFVEALSACNGTVNGGFSMWSAWTNPSCGITCGSTNSVIRSRTRSCSKPVPRNGGLQCLGDVVQTTVKTCNFTACQVNGGLTAWTQWTDPACVITCGQRSDVMRTRTRSCTNPAPSNGGRDCTGSRVEVLQKTCFFSPCVVNGGLTPWTEWSGPPCVSTCEPQNDVFRTRTRSCTNPAPSNGGLNCTGPFVEVKASCVEPVNGGFTQWTQWTNPPCDITCGSTNSVTRSRTRSCTNPVATNGGQQCSGDIIETLVKTCVFAACPVNGGLTNWTQWTNPPCSITCGSRTDVTRTRTRSCTNPPPSNGGQACTGPFLEVEPRTCNFSACVVNGGFTLWTEWTNPPCGITCGNRTEIRTRTRSCTNPAPSNGGLPCSGPIIDILAKKCDFSPCVVPVNGGFTEWTQWTNPPCGITCGSTNSVVRSRTRSCTNPVASNGGQSCTGNRVETLSQPCVFNACRAPVNGGLTLWTQWTNPGCGITCGEGSPVIRTRHRTCTNPAPANGGQSCTGPFVQTLSQNCSFPACAVNGGFTQWSQWTNPACGITCGSTNSVTRSRFRSCTNPVASNGGQSCTGDRVQTLIQTCVFTPCPVNGGLTQWTQWTNPPCGIFCGTRSDILRTRSRTCSNPAPSNGGLGCNGPFVETTQNTCAFAPCVVNGGFTQWTQWTNPTCGITCGSANSLVQSRSRSCTNPVPSHGGQGCSGDRVQTLAQTCVFSSCPVNGNLTQWSQWTNPVCGITCGTRTNISRTRTRTCTNPAPSFGGATCTDSLQEVQPKNCSFSPCPVNGGFTQWTQWTTPSCGITCGSSNSVVRSRTRSCTNPAPANGGQQCIGNTLETLSSQCTLSVPCPVNGGLSLWTEWTNPPCNSSCVIRTRTRSCSNPPPSNGGLNCVGAILGVARKTCTNVPCLVPVNGGFTAWTAWTGPPCSVTCGTGPGVTRSRSRTCTNPAPSNGGADCFGDVLQTISTPCNFAECGGLCTSLTYRNGIGYRYHPTDCDKYIQCYNNPNGNVVAMYRRCPFGKFWNQVTFQCDDSWRAVCPHDKCKDNSTANFNLLGSCRAYWECDTNFVAVPRCCGVGYSYVDRQGCMPNVFCQDLCPTACEDKDLCDKRPDWTSNPATYNMSVGVLGWVPTSCASGTYFDITNCGCSAVNQFCSASNAVTFTAGSSLTSALTSWLQLSNVDVTNGIANFNGSSRLEANITMPAASSANPLIVRFRYRESGAVFGRRVLVSTSGCRNGSSLVIAVDSYTMTFELKSWYDWTVKLPVSMAGFSRGDWKTVTFMYAGYDMLAVVESETLKYAAKVHAPQSTIMRCGLTFGSDSKTDATNNFIGQLDEMSLYQCNPGNLY